MNEDVPFAGKVALLVGCASVVAGVLLVAGAIVLVAWGRGRL